jgi:hypothetical protein
LSTAILGVEATPPPALLITQSPGKVPYGYHGCRRPAHGREQADAPGALGNGCLIVGDYNFKI